ncbi:kinase-like domain-containing protein [Penicillium verhagenii]|uniref:kinase-like domain-containing protein n=1 Tax=Penicillium verhagenii TaxID=1562060 RepID=UPI00254538DC|nr:kinase-like domain-containing protein [Penicillium verhagenii]KAJ5947762.1 kinase-like domain-containing protein [Penicillium verhagenii]
MANPYEADPDKIPITDLYVDVPFYGRYYPKPDDFCVDLRHVNSQTTDSLRYWASVVSLCTEEIRIYPADEGGRDVFALGSVIVKSSHLHPHTHQGAPYMEIDFTYADENELRAIVLAKAVLKNVKVPEIYFAGKVNSRQVLIQERLPGVALCVAWPYLTSDQTKSFKEQARGILRQLHATKPTKTLQARSHVVPDPNILNNGRINPLEAKILFATTNDDTDMSFMHNDFTQPNCIVDIDTIVGLIDWEMAGFFGWNTAGEVHRQIRTPQREHFVNANLEEEQLRDMIF